MFGSCKYSTDHQRLNRSHYTGDASPLTNRDEVAHTIPKSEVPLCTEITVYVTLITRQPILFDFELMRKFLLVLLTSIIAYYRTYCLATGQGIRKVNDLNARKFEKISLF